MQMYKVLGVDGKEYGPIDAGVLCQWIAQRRASCATSIQAEGCSEWKPLAAFPEFAQALAGNQAVPAWSGPRPNDALPLGAVKTSGLAIASLVCGLVGFLVLPGLAGLVLGIMALVKISSSKGRLGGQGLAIVGMCLSGLMLFAILPVGMLLPALARAKAKAQRVSCVSNLKAIVFAARMYSDDTKQVFPPDFLTMSNFLNTPAILVCPTDTKHTRAHNWAEFDPRLNSSYEYLKPNIAESNAMNEIIFRCPIHDNLGLGDGSVQQRRRK